MKDILLFISGFLLVVVVIYSMYWIFKTVSYEVFYESMVQKTVQEIVKTDCLK
jgi:hypothetical protein